LTGNQIILPIPTKISTYDEETGGSWIVETANPEEYRRFFNWIDKELVGLVGSSETIVHLYKDSGPSQTEQSKGKDEK